MTSQLLRYAAFTDTPQGGNPAGVWIGDAIPTVGEMQCIAAEVGYSETAFLAPLDHGRWTVRYFSPEAEVPFCGHATIASGVALADRDGPGPKSPGLLRFATQVGEVPVAVRLDDAGRLHATLTSVEPEQRQLEPALFDAALDALGWRRDELDRSIPAGLAYAGAWHLVIAVADRSVLARLEYDFEGLRALMLEHELTTLQLVWRETPTAFHARNPFPVGGVVEDPATGAAAAAFGGYLRALRAIDLPASITVHQGHDMGRPSTLQVEIPVRGGIDVSGTAVRIEAKA